MGRAIVIRTSLATIQAKPAPHQLAATADGGGSVGNGGAGGTGGSPGNVRVILTSGVSIIITSSNNGSVVGLQASAISGNGGNGAGAGLSSGGPGGAGGSSVNQLATITLESGSSVSVTNQSKGSSAGVIAVLSQNTGGVGGNGGREHLARAVLADKEVFWHRVDLTVAASLPTIPVAQWCRNPCPVGGRTRRGLR